MAKASLHQKVHLLVDFLLGMRLHEPYAILVDYGWSTDKLDQGWRLVEQAGRARFSAERFNADRSNAELLAFKERWFPLVRLVLAKKNPRIVSRLIGGYESRAQGAAGFLVEPFLSTLAELETSADSADRAARELLRERGLTADVITGAAHLIEQSRQLVTSQPPSELLDAEARAEAELWDFYLEWSGIARRAITNRNLLRALGLNKAGRPARGLGKKDQKVGNAYSEGPMKVLVGATLPQLSTNK